MYEDRDKSNGNTIGSYNQLFKHEDENEYQVDLLERAQMNPDNRKRKELQTNSFFDVKKKQILVDTDQRNYTGLNLQYNNNLAYNPK